MGTGPVTFTEAIGPRARAALRDAAVRRSWPAGSVLFHEGEPATHVVIVDRGTVKIVTTSPSGVEAVLALRGPGEVLGELSAIDGSVRSAAAVATEPVTALVLPASAFRAFLDAHASAAVALLELLASRLRELSRQRAEFGSYDATARLAHLLAELADTYGEPTGDGDEIELRVLSQDEIASFCGASREAVARGLRALRDAGVVSTGRRVVTISDIDRLRSWDA